jgi:cytochrome c oxidase cbb3-type subunit 2
MPSYGFFAERRLETDDIVARLEALSVTGVPYDEAMLENAEADLLAQADPDANHNDLLARYPKAAIGDFDGNPDMVTELDAIIAYLQILGRMVDFPSIDSEDVVQQ